MTKQVACDCGKNPECKLCGGTGVIILVDDKIDYALESFRHSYWNYFTDVIEREDEPTINNFSPEFNIYDVQGHFAREIERPIYNRAYVDRLFRDGLNDY